MAATSSTGRRHRRPRRKELEIAARRRDVLEIAERLFAARGFSGVSMNQIAEEAGISVGSLYNLFPGKEELFQAVVLNAIEENQPVLDAVVADESLHPLEALKRFLQAMIEAVRSHQLLFRMVAESMVHARPVMGKKAGEFRKRHRIRLGQLAEILRRGVEAGVFRVDVDPHRFAAALAGTMMGLLSYMVETEGEVDAEFSADLIVEFLINGIGWRRSDETAPSDR